AERALELLQAGGERRLRDEAVVRGLREVQPVGEGDEIRQLAQRRKGVRHGAYPRLSRKSICAPNIIRPIDFERRRRKPPAGPGSAGTRPRSDPSKKTHRYRENGMKSWQCVVCGF